MVFTIFAFASIVLATLGTICGVIAKWPKIKEKFDDMMDAIKK